MKVYVIQADNSAGDPVENRNKLGKAIGSYLCTVDTMAYFHDYAAPVGGAPVIILECTDGFLNQVKKFPGYKSAHVISGAATERSQKLQAYFTGAPLLCKLKPPPKFKP